MTPEDSQIFESYVPVYDTVPSAWEDARPFIIEQLKKIATAVNSREIGFFLDEELLTGKSFIPGPNPPGGSSQLFRTVLRKVVDFSPLTVGLNTKPHGIVIDANFTLVQMWAAATNATAFTGNPIPNGGETISYNATDILIISTAARERCFAVMEYMQEL